MVAILAAVFEFFRNVDRRMSDNLSTSDDRRFSESWYDDEEDQEAEEEGY